MNAVAISNNDMVYLQWHVEDKIPDCLGFSVIRHEASSQRQQPLPAMVGFSSDTKTETGGRRQIQRHERLADPEIFVERPLAKRGGTYWYEIVPMIGTPRQLAGCDPRDETTV
jgi:hypothetical protein